MEYSTHSLGEWDVCDRFPLPTSRFPVVRILVVNWQDRENPQAGGAKVTNKHAIWQGRTPAGPLTLTSQLPPDLQELLHARDPAPWP